MDTKEEQARKRLFEKIHKAYVENNNRVLVESCTGSGKCKIALDLMQPVLKKGEPLDIVVPQTEIIKDWKMEIVKWGYTQYNGQINIYCDRSLHKHKTQANVIFDEAHLVTTRMNKYLLPKTYIHNLVALSATVEHKKRNLLTALRLTPSNTVEYSLDQGVDDGLVSPYEVLVVKIPMDKKNKNVRAGAANKPFYVTEADQFNYLTKRISETQTALDYASIRGNKQEVARLHGELKMRKIWRTKGIYDFPSKRLAAKEVLKQLPDDLKLLGFCGSIEQCDKLFKHKYHSKTNEDDLIAFRADKITRLGSVAALNMGINISNLQIGLVVQVQSSFIHLAQRAGRTFRKDPKDPDKVGLLIILVSDNPAEMGWLKGAISRLDQRRITWVEFQDILAHGIGKFLVNLPKS